MMRRIVRRRCWMVPVSIVTIITVSALIFLSQKVEDPEGKNARAFRADYVVLQAPMPDTLSIAGEPIPLNIWYVRESLDRDLLVNVYWQSNTLLMIKRASRWMPEMKRVFQEMGVPEDLAYLSLVESGLTGAVSPAGAEGYWQFIESTGKSYGLEINSEVDERYHISKSTHAAARYLLDAKSRFGSWILAAASYNRGMEGLAKAIEKQKETDFFKLWLNQETSRYIYRLMAIKLIVEKPSDYGFHLRTMDLYPPLVYDTLIVDSSISDLPAFAKSLGLSFRTLKEYNPWLRTYTLTLKSTPYQLLIPKRGNISYPNDWFDEPNQQYIGIDR